MEGPNKCAVCKADVLGTLRHCALHAGKYEPLPIRSCVDCALPCVAPDTHCVHHSSSVWLTPFEAQLRDYEEAQAFSARLNGAGVTSSSSSSSSSLLEGAAKRRRAEADFASPVLMALLEVPTGSESAAAELLNGGGRGRAALVDRMVRLHELECKRAAWLLSRGSTTAQRAPAEWISKANAPESSSKLPPCKSRGCPNDALPGGALFCLAHILLDPRQALFKGCSVCNYPIFRQNASGLCVAHTTLK